jgi:Protein of unknown function (DUF3363)
MGLAEAAGSDQWLVRQDFETALRAMQRLGDRQKVLAAHGVTVSDTRLPLVMFDLRRCTRLEGRILVHGEDEGTGRTFMMLEGTDAKVHCIYHTPEMVEARGRGGLRPNGFVRLHRLFENGRPVLEMEELSQSRRITLDRHHHEEAALKVTDIGIARVEDDPRGGLAHDQSAVREAAVELEEVRKRKRERHYSRDR